MLEVYGEVTIDANKQDTKHDSHVGVSEINGVCIVCDVCDVCDVCILCVMHVMYVICM